MNTTNREKVVELALSTSKLSECKAAERAVTEWMTQNPDDLGMHEVASLVGIARAVAEERKATLLSGFASSASPVATAVKKPL